MKYLSNNYVVANMDADADFDSLLGVAEE